MGQPTILFVPGLRDFVAEHWQTLLAADMPGSRIIRDSSESQGRAAASGSL